MGRGGIAVKKPIFFDENKPLAHYEAAGKLKKEADTVIKFGKIFPFAALPVGIVCVAFEPFLMALFALFGIIFTILAVIGCSIRNIRYALASIPLAFAAALTTFFTDSAFSLIGAVVYVIAGLSQCRVLSALSSLRMLKELPGFPFFDPAMDNISFAAMEYHGGDEFIEGELVEERTERAKIVPTEPPSEDMGEIVTDGIEAPALLTDISADLDGGFNKYERNANEHTAYERMVNAQTPDSSDVSDIDLLY